VVVQKPAIAVAAAVLLIAGGTWLFLRHRGGNNPTIANTAAPPVESAPQQTIAHPVPDDEGKAAATAPVPSLAESDAPLGEALGNLTGADAAKNFLQPENLVRHIVVTVDNLPRQKVALDKRPTVPVSGNFMVNGDELHATLDRRNFERYKPMVAVISKLDMRQVAGVYIHFYPLFQQTYQDLGYPTGYFNDRLVQVIDSLLATPPLQTVELERPNVMYTFADPALEKLPAGQKILIRMGPENAAAIKTKLMELRSIITAAPPKH
jgi:hypothetical protein